MFSHAYIQFIGLHCVWVFHLRGGGLIKIKTISPQWAAEVLPSQTSCDFITNLCGYTIQCCKAHTKPIAMLATIVRFCIQKMNLLKGQFRNSLRFPFYVINPVDNTKLPCVTSKPKDNSIQSLTCSLVVVFLCRVVPLVQSGSVDPEVGTFLNRWS